MGCIDSTSQQKRCTRAAIVASDGALAQLGERLHGMQEVRGSTPLGSTTSFLITENH